MSATEPRDDLPAPTTDSARGREYPQFDLRCLRDDEDDPATVTVFAPGEAQVTNWLTVDEAHAVPLEETR